MCENNLSPDFFTEHLIDPNNIWGNDDLERKPFADDLTHKVEHAAKRQSFAVSLHGGWGTGKTYLLRRWQAQLQKEERRVVYFNAWEDDFQADPLTAIVGQLWKAMPQEAMPWTVRLWEAIKRLDWKEIFLTIAQRKTGLSIKDIQSTTQKTVGEYRSVRKKLDDFKEALGNFAVRVWKDTNFPLVLIVDELDRCRPTFAMQVFERIKHLFGMPNIVFVFGINKTGLQESIKSVYGNIDTEDYLRRFFDINLALPPASAKAYCEHLLSEHNDLVSALNVPHHPNDVSWPDAIKDLFVPLVGYMNLPLRQVEHAFRLLRFAVNVRRDPANEIVLSVEGWSISLLILLKIKNPAMYAGFISGEVRCAEVIDFFLPLAPDSLDRPEHIALLVESKIYCHARGDESRKIRAGLKCLRDKENLDSSIASFLSKRTIMLSPNVEGIATGIIDDMNRNAHGPDPRNTAAALLDLADDSHR